MSEPLLPDDVDVVLREVTTADLDVFFEQQREPDGVAMAAFPPRDRDTHMTHWQKILEDTTVVTKTIEVDGRVAGNAVSWM